MALRVRTTAKAALVRAVVWLAASVMFEDVAWGRMRALREAGLAVSPWRYLQVAFWVVMLGFWGWEVWVRLPAMRAERRGN